MLKQTLPVIIFFLICNSSYSQTVEKKLLVKYSEKELVQLQKNDPQEYEYLVNSVTRGLFISEIPTKKEVVFDGVLNIDPKQEHTYLTLGKEILDRYQYYRIEGTNLMLVIQPRIFLDKRVLNK